VAAIKAMIKTNDFRRVGFMDNSFRFINDFWHQCCQSSSILIQRCENTIQRNVKKACQVFT